MLHVTASAVRISVKFIDTAPTLDIEFDGLEIVSPEPVNPVEIPDDTGSAHTPTGSHPDLTPRQLEVLREIVKGEPSKAIARTLGLSEGTVKIHLKGLFKVLGVRNRSQAAIAGLEILAKQ
ncbi:helix-turn-helix domain-containing protein [Brucella intermedia]|uniref:helix-turn-helix domain-containing protein n=1 Tax=Brucella intermedia TaxID=94625 RepID=UPI000EFB0CC2|nr:LuxR C-terminal-related transcriptional regulator [Brucella intermedia]KAB2720388.1 response regulator transcription factor [Brucella intermedia]